MNLPFLHAKSAKAAAMSNTGAKFTSTAGALLLLANLT